jgi:hypothetical protein
MNSFYKIKKILELNTEIYTKLNCWAVNEALGRRIVIEFSDKSVMSIGGDGIVTLRLYQQSLSITDPVWKTTRLKDLYTANLGRVDELTNLIFYEAKERGKFWIHISWLETLEQINEDEDSFDGDLYSLSNQVGKIVEESIKHDYINGIASMDEESFLHENCDYFNFETLTEELESRNWIVIWNECCGACSGASIREAIEENPTKANSPSFVIFGQNCENIFHSDGSISNYIFTLDEKGAGLEIVLAEKLGFQVSELTSDYGTGLYTLNGKLLGTE